jgi:hypothetical protein
MHAMLTGMPESSHACKKAGVHLSRHVRKQALISWPPGMAWTAGKSVVLTLFHLTGESHRPEEVID